jgi:hypothetical protein
MNVQRFIILRAAAAREGGALFNDTGMRVFISFKYLWKFDSMN